MSRLDKIVNRANAQRPLFERASLAELRAAKRQSDRDSALQFCNGNLLYR
jgi:hypothetical protein